MKTIVLDDKTTWQDIGRKHPGKYMRISQTTERGVTTERYEVDGTVYVRTGATQ